VEDASDRILTPEHDTRNLRHFVSLLGKQKHLIAGSALHIGSLFIVLPQFGKSCNIEWG
jgi:hypothetical protein